MAQEPDMLTTYGEITKQQLFKVRGDPHWSSTEKEARRVHMVLKKAEAQGFTKQKGHK